MSKHGTSSPMRTVARVILGVLGFPLFAVAGFMTLFGTYTLFAEPFDATTLVLVGLFFGATAAGFGMVWWAFQGGRPKTASAPSAQERERQLLDLARRQDGRVTLADVAVGTSLDVDGARRVLHRLQVHGVADLQVSDGGQEVYVFPAFEDGGADKKTATSILADEVEFENLETEEASESTTRKA